MTMGPFKRVCPDVGCELSHLRRNFASVSGIDDSLLVNYNANRHASKRRVGKDEFTQGYTDFCVCFQKSQKTLKTWWIKRNQVQQPDLLRGPEPASL